MRALHRPRRPRPSGFTLMELLVVIVIVLIVSAAALPVIRPALSERKVSSAALIVQAELARSRDAAIRANAPRGFRLLGDPSLGRFSIAGTTPAFTRLLAIEPGPDYSEGLILKHYPSDNYPVPLMPPSSSMPTPTTTYTDIPAAALTSINPPTSPPILRAVITEAKRTDLATSPPPNVYVPNSPTSWFWNVRQGEKIRFGDTGHTYTIAGPMLIGPYAAQNTKNTKLSTSDQKMVNPERFINWGSTASFQSKPTNLNDPVPDTEFLFLVDGIDNDLDGYIDEGFDGIDNDGDLVVDPGFNGIDDNGNGLVDETAELYFNGGGEWEQETIVGTVPATLNGFGYTITRLPVPSSGARATDLPTGVVIDLTTWSTGNPERSILPVDINTGYVDVLISPTGQVVQAGASTQTGPPLAFPFYHFWLADAEDVFEPVATANVPYLLPMPDKSLKYPAAGDTTARILKSDRRLVSVNTRTGRITTTSPENFDGTNTHAPFLPAELGVKEEP